MGEKKISIKYSECVFLPKLSVMKIPSFVVKGKNKAIPLQAWTGPEGSRRLRLPDFKTVDP